MITEDNVRGPLHLQPLPLSDLSRDYWQWSGPGSVVGIATVYGLDGPGIESRWGARFSARVQTGPEAHPASCTMGDGSFLGVRCGRGVTLTPHPLLVPRSKIEYSYTSAPPKGLRGLWQGENYLSTVKDLRFPPILLRFHIVCDVMLCHQVSVTWRFRWLQYVLFKNLKKWTWWHSGTYLMNWILNHRWISPKCTLEIYTTDTLKKMPSLSWGVTFDHNLNIMW